MNLQEWDNAIIEYSERYTARTTAIEGAIVLWASQFNNERLPRWGDCGVLQFARIASYELQNMDTESVCVLVISRLGSISAPSRQFCSPERDKLITTLINGSDFEEMTKWKEELCENPT
jgi:hypothetical protein